MSILTDTLAPFAPTEGDISGAQTGLKYALAYPGAVQYLSDNPSALSTALTIGNFIPKSPTDPNKNYFGLLLIGGIIFLAGLLVGKYLKF